MDGQYNPNNREADDYEAAGQSMKDYMGQVAPLQREKRRRHTKRIVLLVILVIALLAGGSYFFLKQMNKGDTPAQPATAEAIQEEPKEIPDASPEEFTARMLRVSFEHPGNWEVQEDEQTGQVTLRSVVMNLTNGTGQKETGQVVMAIRPKGTTLPEFDEGNALAALASEKIAYSKPSSQQRGETYLSFLQYAASGSDGSGLDAVYITGDYGYQKDQAIPKIDIAKIDPLVSVSFLGCSGTGCSGSGAEPLTLSPDGWAVVSARIKPVLQSLTFN